MEERLMLISAQILLTDELCFRALMENTADSIYFKDRICRLQKVSRKMALDLGFPNQEEIYGKTDIDLFCSEFGVYERASMSTRLNGTRDFISLLNEFDVGRSYWTYKALDFGLVDKDGLIVEQDLVELVSMRRA